MNRVDQDAAALPGAATEVNPAPSNGQGPAVAVTSAVSKRRPGQGRGGGRSAYATRDLTSGSIPKNLIFLAWPQYIEGLLRVVDQIADLVWAGFLGHRAIAGMGAAQQWSQLGFTARQGLDTSMRAMVSRAIGMQDTALANRVVIHSILLTLGYSLVLSLVGIFFTEVLLRVTGISEGVIAEGAAYMRIQFVSQATIGLQMLMGNSLAAAGDTLTPLKSSLVSRLVHIFLSPALVFGLFGLPAIGLPGAALANAIAHVLAIGVLLWVLLRGTSRLHLTLRGFHFDSTVLRQLLKIGLPASVNGMERSVAQLFILVLVAPFGDLTVAAYTLSRRVEMLGQAGGMGLGNAAGTIVGQSIGAGKPERAKTTILWAAGLGMAAKSIFASILLLFPTAILLVFTRDADLIDIALPWVMILALGMVPTGLNQAFNQSFQTAGATLFVMLGTLGLMWGIELPLAFVLSKYTELGPLGVAWGMIVPMLFRPFINIPYYLSGRWLRIRVFS
ncbi:MAG: MATE family efflux transporter [Chloroflexi bacterium]|nr:MATE family efflux transporter [Chloroflexota bacterium]